MDIKKAACVRPDRADTSVNRTLKSLSCRGQGTHTLEQTEVVLLRSHMGKPALILIMFRNGLRKNMTGLTDII